VFCSRERSDDNNNRQLQPQYTQQQMGLSGWQLVPKATGVRPIAMLQNRVPLLLPFTAAAPADDTTSLQWIHLRRRRRRQLTCSNRSRCYRFEFSATDWGIF